MEERYRNEEAHLVESVLSGDQKAFATLYDKYAPVIYGVISKTISDSKDSEELLQEIFMTIWHKMPLYDGTKQHLYTWMYTIARDLIAKNVSLHPAYDETVRPGATINKPANGPDNGQPSETAFDLIYFKGYTYEEAARRLNLTMAALQTNIRIELNYLRGTLVK